MCNYALLLVNAEMLGFNDPNLEVRSFNETVDVDANFNRYMPSM